MNDVEERLLDERKKVRQLFAERDRIGKLATQALADLRGKCTHPAVVEREYTKGNCGERICLICHTKERWESQCFYETLRTVHIKLPGEEFDKLVFRIRKPAYADKEVIKCL